MIGQYLPGWIRDGAAVLGIEDDHWKSWPIVPVSAPRQVRRDSFKPSPHVRRYRAFRDQVRLYRVELPPCAWLIFELPMPDSWSRAKRARLLGMPHEQKPDRDNLEKALLDAVYAEDSGVWHGMTTKIWARRGRIWAAPLLILSPPSAGVADPSDG